MGAIKNFFVSYREWKLLTGAVSILLVLVELLCSALFDLPHAPYGKVLDMSRFALTWADEFDGEALDASKWGGHYVYGDSAAVRRGGMAHKSLAEVGEGSLKIYTKYLDEGAGGGGAGYYTYLMDTNGRFEQRYGYFEIRCKLPKGEGHWAAFWMLTDEMVKVDGTGTDGAEIDIFEAPNFHKKGRAHNAVCSNIHYDGYGEALRSGGIGDFLVPEPYDSYNTYGLEWNEDEYIFYINGVESGSTSFGGASRVPEYLILSVEIGGENGVPGESWAGDIRRNEHLPTAFEIDYVRAYQYKELL